MKQRIFLNESHRTPVAWCPVCLSRIDAATGVSEGRPARGVPVPGSVTICAYCGSVLVFTDLMQLRQATPEEAAPVEEWNVARLFREGIKR